MAVFVQSSDCIYSCLSEPRKGAKQLVKRKADRCGRMRVYGVSKALKESAAYPMGFGFAVQALVPTAASCPARSVEDICDSSSDESLDDFMQRRCRWRALR